MSDQEEQAALYLLDDDPVPRTARDWAQAYNDKVLGSVPGDYTGTCPLSDDPTQTVKIWTGQAPVRSDLVAFISVRVRSVWSSIVMSIAG